MRRIRIGKRAPLRVTIVGAAAVASVWATTAAASPHHRDHATPGSIDPQVGAVTISGPDGNPVINPKTGRPYLVDLNTLPSGAGPNGTVTRLPSRPGTESYLVQTYVARDTLIPH